MPSAAGVIPSRRPACPTVRGRANSKFRTGLIGKSGHHGVVDVAENQALVAAEGFDIRHLALEIDVVFCIDLEMHHDPWVNGRQFRPDAAYLRPADLRIGQ